MEALFDNILQFLGAGWEVLVSLGALLLPWTPLVAWIVFWLFAVNWVKLREVMLHGGCIAVVLIGVVMILIWGMIDPSDATDGKHHLFGLAVSNFVGKTVYVTGLLCIMFLCGSVQLSGCCASCCRFEDDD